MFLVEMEDHFELNDCCNQCIDTRYGIHLLDINRSERVEDLKLSDYFQEYNLVLLNDLNKCILRLCCIYD